MKTCMNSKKSETLTESISSIADKDWERMLDLVLTKKRPVVSCRIYKKIRKVLLPDSFAV